MNKIYEKGDTIKLANGTLFTVISSVIYENTNALFLVDTVSPIKMCIGLVNKENNKIIDFPDLDAEENKDSIIDLIDLFKKNVA